jgi:hypothetical protein
VNDTKPMIAVLSRGPLVSEAIAAAVDGLADVRHFSSDGDTDGLLRSLLPDAVVVDSGERADAAVAFARELDTPLLHILLRERRLRIYGREGWREDLRDGTSSEGIRNALAGALYGRQRP